MSVDKVRRSIEKFLSNDEPEVLVLKGKWGVGKTYSWKNWLLEFKDKVVLKNYTYASLFGVNSITELKTKIYSSMRNVKDIGKEFDINQLAEIEGVENAVPKLREWLKYIGFDWLQRYKSTLELFSVLLIKNTLICIDDFERKK